MTRSLRARVRRQIGLAVVLALALFAIPLGIVLDQLLMSRALTGLQRDVTRTVTQLPDNPIDTTHPPAAPVGHDNVRLALYSTDGRFASGRGPASSQLATTAAADGREHHGDEAGDLAVVLPIMSDGAAVGSVRAAIPSADLRHQVWLAWGLLAGLAVAVVAVSGVLARAAATRIAVPFERITRAAHDLAAGRHPELPASTGITEADAATAALYDGSRRVGDLLESERNFIDHASHQLRTPLSALLLHLQQNPPAVRAALERVEQLEATIADLLAVRGSRDVGRCDPADVARRVVARRHGSVAALRIEQTPPVAASEATVRQCVEVLLDNAFEHGMAPVTVTVESYGDSVAVEVADSGAGLPDDCPFGTGLTLATTLARRAGGELLIRRRRPRPRFCLLLPAAGDVPDQVVSSR